MSGVVVEPGGACAFPREELERRQARLRAALAARGIDLLLLTGPENVFYLTGQQTPGYYTFQCLAVPAEGAPFLLLRRLEYLNAVANTHLDDITPYDDGADPAAALAGLLERRGWRGRRIALDRSSWFLPVSAADRLTAALGPLPDGSGLVEPLRMIKSGAEIERIERAAATADAGMRAGMAAVRAGATENDVVAAMMHGAIAAGCEYVGMEPLVTSGPRSGIPHTTWRRRRLEPGDPILLELAGCWDRYHAGLMRTAWVGAPPADATAMYAACREALAAALDALRPGNTCADVHRAAQGVIDRHGYTEGYRKRSGYSTGISFAPDWGEGNVLSLYHGVEVELRPGMAFHVPIALRDYGRFTVGVSETAVVTAEGCHTLSGVARDLLVV